MFVQKIRHAIFTGVVAMTCRLRIFCLDGVEKLREPSFVTVGAVEPIFVADFDIMQRKRRGMAVFCALGAPLRVRRRR